jgi:hypothetical protein
MTVRSLCGIGKHSYLMNWTQYQTLLTNSEDKDSYG